MKRDSFAYGIVFGIAVALPLSIATTTALRRLPDSNLVNFGPALIGVEVFSSEIFIAVVALVIATVFLFRKRWRPAGFWLSFGLTIVGWWARVMFY
jgi:hypothetical protein